MEFAWIPSTQWYRQKFNRAYLMGSPAGEGGDDERPQHEVSLDGFWMAVTPTTNAQWRAVMKSNPPSKWTDDNRPVEQVTWDEACEFAKKLMALDNDHWAGLKVSYSLPSEAEWEYAARAGTKTKYWFGNDESALGKHAWFSDNSGSETKAVKGKPASPWGLCDVYGNVWEWCRDWYDANYYSRSPKHMPECVDGERKYRVLRGGSWGSGASDCRAAYRNWVDAASRGSSCGFRVCFRLHC
jgi:formylglycine-generating enzyme required for sulfatase activity